MESKDDIRLLVEKYLNNDATLIDRVRLDKWLEDDTELRNWLVSHIDNADSTLSPEVRARLDARLYEIYESTPDDDADNDIMHRDDTPSRKLRFWKWCAAASIVAVVILSAIFAYTGITTTDINESPIIVSTQAGERSKATLPDGSVITLNHQSEIAYHYDSKLQNRVLNFSGEANFDIHTDPEHPFIVNCDGLRIECRGTSFNVKGYPDENEVTVVLASGSIIAGTDEQTITMKPGTKVSYDKQLGHLRSSVVEPAEYTEWMRDCDRFNDESFDDVLRTMSRRYGVSISAISPALHDVHLTGSIAGTSLNEAVRLLANAANAQYIMESDSTIYFYRENK
jgi:ferric-dicitrate binding protein FerR (iron transport regulator)